MKIVVIGGGGLIGKKVVKNLRTTYGASLDLKAPFARKMTNPKAKP
jgi:uncharacterized protein YbjT (DUF2867 family)